MRHWTHVAEPSTTRPSPDGAWTVSMIAWGLPSDPRSFSGYSHHLTRALATSGHIRREFSAKRLAPFDLLAGAIRIGAGGPLHVKPVVSRRWMWSQRGQERLTRRLAEAIRRAGDRGPFLQVGTLVEVPRELGPHFMLTDMTIPQAEREGMFDVGRMDGGDVAEAIRVQAKVLRSAEHVFVLTEWCRESMLADFDLAPDRVSVVYAGSNLVVPPRLDEARVDREILFVGMDWDRKGGPLLAEAFRLVRRTLPDATLRVVGCRPPLDAPGIVVEGFLDKRNPGQYARLARAYLRASVFCLPSRFDPFPNVLVEAAGVGLPSVAIDNGSRREAVADGVTGYLAATPTPAALAEALLKCLVDPKRCRAMGEAARARAHSLFTWERVIGRIGAVVGRDGVAAA